MDIIIQGTLLSFIIIKVAPIIFRDNIDHKTLFKVYSILAVAQFLMQVSFYANTMVKNIQIALVAALIGTIGAVAYKLVVDKFA